MSAGTSLTFPGGRAVAGWWRQLAPHRPAALWVAHLLVHRVEALTQVATPVPLDGPERLALDLLARQPAADLEALDGQLHLGRPLLRQMLEGLRREGLVEAPGGAWSVTPRGRQARERGEFARAGRERRTFHFLDRSAEGKPACFLALRKYRGLPWPAGTEWRFAPAWLADCTRQPAEWKRRHDFPPDVEAILGPADATEAAEWESVIVDSPERLPAAIIRGRDDGGEYLRGFAFNPDGWLLYTFQPVFALGDAWRETFPELAEEVSAEKWAHAWRAWCQSRSLAAPDAEPRRLELDGHRLRVEVSRPFHERLRESHGQVFKGEVWLLAGEGRVRAAAQVEVAEPPPAPAAAS